MPTQPEPKQGPVATDMEREGRQSHAGDDRRAAQARNAEREALRLEAEIIERDKQAAQKRQTDEEEQRKAADKLRAEAKGGAG